MREPNLPITVGIKLISLDISKDRYFSHHIIENIQNTVYKRNISKIHLTFNMNTNW